MFQERGYGFVKLDSSGRTAFFHVSIFPQRLRNVLEEYKPITAEIGPDRTGQGFQIKEVLKYNGEALN